MKSKHIIPTLILCCIIVFQCIYTITVFNKKEVFHSDEMWSYGLANSYKRPYLFLEPNTYLQKKTIHDSLPLFDKWHTGKYFKNYLEVSEDEKFSYDSVIYNQQHDMHPPLYYFILHTICSFFPETFSWYYAFIPQILYLCITQIFLYLLAYELTKRKPISLLICFMYACSTIALFTFTFIRQYSLLTMLNVIYTYYLVHMLNQGICLKRVIPVMIFAFLSAMTQYFALIYIGITTFFVCVYLLIKKNKIDCITFGLLMCIVVAIYTICWPAAFVSASEYSSEYRYDFLSEFKFLYGLTNYFSIGIPIVKSYKTVFISTALIALFIIPIIFLFRNEDWFKNFNRCIKRLLREIFCCIKNKGIVPWILLASYILSVIIICMKSSVIIMGFEGVRYTSFIAPAMLAASVCILYYVFKGISKKYAKYLICAIVFLSCTVMMLFIPKYFITQEYDGPSREEIREELAGQDVAVFLNAVNHLQFYPEYLMDTSRVYLGSCLSKYRFLNKKDTINNDKLYMLICGYEVIYENEKDAVAETMGLETGMTDKEMEMYDVQFIEKYEQIGKELGFPNSECIVRMENNEYDTVILKLTK